MTNPMTGPDAATGQTRILPRYQVYGSKKTGRCYVIDMVSDELVSGPMNKRGAEMLAKKMEQALAGSGDLDAVGGGE